MAVDIILENMPPQVAFFLNDGQSLATLNREEIRSLRKDIRLLLTKARSAESLQRNAQATQLVLQYLALPKWQQKVVRAFFINQLRALDVQDADEHLPDPTPEEIAQEAEAAAQGQPKPPSASVSVVPIQLAPSERAQVLQNDMGITPASPQELQNMQAQAAQAQETPAPRNHLHLQPPPTVAA